METLDRLNVEFDAIVVLVKSCGKAKSLSVKWGYDRLLPRIRDSIVPATKSYDGWPHGLYDVSSQKRMISPECSQFLAGSSQSLEQRA